MTKLTRRQLASVVTAASATALGAQTAPPVDDLEAARQRQKASSDQLAQQQIPMATEPAFQFKA